MLSRVADSLYWMSRYFERADHCARVLEANHNLMLNPSKTAIEDRWHRITENLGLGPESSSLEPQAAMLELMTDSGNQSSIVSCITGARENASQVREQISSEMWERLNQLYHEVTQMATQFRRSRDFDVQPIFTTMREGTYKFYGVTAATISHGEAWHFIQLGKYMERACALPSFMDAVFASASALDDLDWVGVLSSCSAFEAYCKVYTADMRPDKVAEFLLLNSEFPQTVRYSVEQMQTALRAISRPASDENFHRVERIVGRLCSSLAFAEIEDLITRDFGKFLAQIVQQCETLHTVMHETYIDYPVQTAFEA
jgi:uncharacterized alpha-E superfamily protein